jgi:hypothetical protein
MAKPTLYPDWTVNTDGTNNDVVDPTSGQNNVVEPTAGKKLTGWTYTEKPPRQHFNWLSRLTTQWIRWFDEYISKDVVLTGVISGATTELLVELPTGYTKDNCIITGGYLRSSSGAYYCYPLGYVVPNGASYTAMSVRVGNAGGIAPDYVSIIFYSTGSTPIDINGYNYIISLRKIT